MNKTFIVIAALLCLGSAHAAGSWMFQSQANVSTAQGGVSTGTYTFTNQCELENQSGECIDGGDGTEPHMGFIFIKWDKPLLFLDKQKLTLYS